MYDAPADLSDELQRQIRADRRAHRANPHRCPDEAALRRRDDPRDRATLWRPAFVRDVEKILNVPAYNRYAGKTQVFSFHQNDDISRRGLHVQLVARVARDIGAALGLNLDLIEAIALGHDVGHTPFGHAGERCLDRLYQARCGRRFRHNVHSVEVLDRLYGRNLTLQTLDGVLCHNGEYEQRVFRMEPLGTFADLDARVAACVAGTVDVHTLAPATLEGCVVRVSDIIAYVGKDRQDAESTGLLAPDARFKTGPVGAYNSWVLQALTVDIVEHSYGKDRLEMSEQAFRELAAAKAENNELIYRNPAVEGACQEAIAPRFALLYERCLADLAAGDESAPIFAHHVRPLERHASYYGHAYDWQGDPDRTVVDFLAAMTDDYFMALFDHLFPHEDAAAPLRSYFDR
jgi:dGTPase